MASATKLMHYFCTFLLIAMFTMAGIMKLTPILSPEVHNELKTNFRSFVTVPPASYLQLAPDIYLTLVGVTEIACAACLACPHSKIQLFGHYVLMMIMMGAIWTHFYLKDTVDKMVPAISCLALLLLRLYTGGRLPVKVKMR